MTKGPFYKIKSQQTFYFVKGQTINILGFVGHPASALTTQLLIEHEDKTNTGNYK